MKRIIYTRPDGGVSIVCPSININDPVAPDEEQALARAMMRLPAEAVNPKIID